MSLRTRVLIVWCGFSRRERPLLRSLSRGSPDAVLRCRCKVILALVQGKSPTTIAAGGLCSASQVYRVAHRFIAQGLRGLADQREDNGENKVTEFYEHELFARRGRFPPPSWLSKADLDPGVARPCA